MEELLVLIAGDRSIELKDALSKRGADFLKEPCVHDDNKRDKWPNMGVSFEVVATEVCVTYTSVTLLYFVHVCGSV